MKSELQCLQPFASLTANDSLSQEQVFANERLRAASSLKLPVQRYSTAHGINHFTQRRSN